MRFLKKASLYTFYRIAFECYSRDLFINTWPLSYGSKECLCCERKFALIPDERISAIMTSKGSKAICNSCAEKLIKEGLPHDHFKIDFTTVTEQLKLL
ncbi:MAG TPA: hypothetical protein VHO03_03750 [Ignavibacteriales bacterium]|nr:hypothetical protein [Ignavibacteriales bacterium]